MTIPGLAVTPFDVAARFIGTKESPGVAANPLILSMLRLDATWPAQDEVAWCSAFVNFIAWLLRLPRSKSLSARSWLKVGEPITIEQAEPGFDIVILRRGVNSPGPEVLQAPGHVGFFAGLRASDGAVQLLGGNQGNAVSIAAFAAKDVLGVRRLFPPRA